MENILKDKRVRLFAILSGFFVANALIAEFMGVKIFSLEKTLGFDYANISFLGHDNLGYNLSAGVLLWPVVFIMTDVINEYFGKRGVRFLTFLTIGLIIFGFLMLGFSIWLEPADFWINTHISSAPEAEQSLIKSKVGDYNYAYSLVFGQGLWIIVGSLIAFLVSQLVDIMIFQKIKKWTGEGKVWLRATGSTAVSQLVDSLIVPFVAFYLFANWEISQVVAIALLGYTYKLLMAIILTPCIYISHNIIDRYLGKSIAEEIKSKALLD